eukprot:scaffold2797_cov115-Skeletonema_marinoi.AAC.4
MATQIERDGARKMSGDDQMMFQDHVHPFVDKRRGSRQAEFVARFATCQRFGQPIPRADDSPKSTPASSPAKMSTPGKKVLRPIEMPKPFKI